MQAIAQIIFKPPVEILDRFVIDLMGVKTSDVESDLSLRTDMIQKIRIGYHMDKLRVVFDLVPETDLSCLVVSEKDRLLVSFQEGSSFPDERYPLQ